MGEERTPPPQGFAETAKYVAGIEGSFADHLKHRLSLKTIGKEMFNHITDKVIPQGADEAANLIFNHSAYLPWPGHGGPKPIEAPSVTDPDVEGTALSYTDMLTDAASRGGDDPDRGMSR